jgi:hypothetical protein
LELSAEPAEQVVGVFLGGDEFVEFAVGALDFGEYRTFCDDAHGCLRLPGRVRRGPGSSMSVRVDLR